VTSTIRFRALDPAPWSPVKTLVAITPMPPVQLPREDWQKHLSIPLSRSLKLIPAVSSAPTAISAPPPMRAKQVTTQQGGGNGDRARTGRVVAQLLTTAHRMICATADVANPIAVVSPLPGA
jgi:hypothetical protein